MKNLDEMSPAELGELFPIKLSNHRPEWAAIFEQEKGNIERTFGNEQLIAIEHIGSTAIPRIKAKPTLDMVLILQLDANLETTKLRLNGAGYHLLRRPENPPPHMMFVKGYSEQGLIGQAFHVHLRYGADCDEIRFRNYLRMHPDVAKEYEELKMSIADKYRNDREGYTEGKTLFVHRINKLAREY